MILIILLVIWLKGIRLIHRYFVLFNCFYVLSCFIMFNPFSFLQNWHAWMRPLSLATAARLALLLPQGTRLIVLSLLEEWRTLSEEIVSSHRRSITKKNTLHTSQSLDLFSWSLLLGRHSNMLQCARVEGLEATCAAASGDNEVRVSEIWNKNILSSSRPWLHCSLEAGQSRGVSYCSCMFMPKICSGGKKSHVSTSAWSSAKRCKCCYPRSMRP